MIEIGVKPKPKGVAIEEEDPPAYLIIGDFGGRATAPLAVDRDNFDAVITKLGVTVGGVQFRSLDDFHPDRLYQNLSLFREFDREPARAEPAPAVSDPDLEKILGSASLLEKIVGGEGADPFENYVRELARAHAATPESTDPERDAALQERMRALLHHPRFQAVEAAWRGLEFAIRAAESDSSARFYIAHHPQEEASRDLNGASSLRATHLFELFSARRWRAVFGLYSFSQEASDIEFLGRIALLAANARAPFVAEGPVDTGEHWNELRSIPEASFLGLALPRFLLRLPYGAQTSPLEQFQFEELTDDSPVHAHFLWGNPALACLALLAAGDALNLEGLPVHTYQQDGEWKMTPCAEVWMTEAEVLELIDAGLMPLVGFKDSDRVRLAGFRAINGDELPLA